ncbi:recombinase family protein [Blastochloris tepida]|uniref:Site-specific recombinase n=1 Tax=Blastochloris tepida TaxID=2233851 RepID=A0A348G4K2_9HYPH|nr:recombinase family protein [Blastochloris tepida]BBF94485.1 site-specific recombinase [Blastochloris tepida]
MPKAYSYLRFSTPEQMKGDSFRRQTEAAKLYADRHGLTLDQDLTFRDLGVSAFRGRNAERGSLADFRLAVQTGTVEPGSYLLVESFDRISRMDPWEALPIFQEIINAGITIVTLADGREWTLEIVKANPFRIMESLLVMMRAHEESQTKARRLKEAWSRKRRDVGEKILTTRCPAWLEPRADRSGFDIIPDRAEVVRRIFAALAAGQGQHAITEALNRDGVPTWGDGKRQPATRWHRSYVAKIISNPAVIGTLVPHIVEDAGDYRKRRKPLDPVPNYYPAVIEEELYQRVKALQSGTSAPLRGRHAQSGVVRNVLGGLAKCPVCGATMTRVTKGASKKAGRPYLVCDAAKSGNGCQYRSVKLDFVEEALRQHASFLCGTCPTSGGDGAYLDASISGLEDEIDRKREEVRRLVMALRKGTSAEIVRTIRELERDIEQCEAEKAKLIELASASTPALLIRRVDELESALTAEPFDQAKANLRLRECFSSVIVDYRRGVMDMNWKHGGFTSIMFMWVDED